MSREEALADLLSSLFSPQLLRVFLARRHGRAIEDTLPGPPIAPAVLSLRACQELHRQGLVVDTFFDALVAEMQAADCGVETGIEIECPSCGNGMEVDVGFGRAFFTRDFSRIRSPDPQHGRTS